MAFGSTGHSQLALFVGETYAPRQTSSGMSTVHGKYSARPIGVAELGNGPSFPAATTGIKRPRLFSLVARIAAHPECRPYPRSSLFFYLQNGYLRRVFGVAVRNIETELASLASTCEFFDDILATETFSPYSRTNLDSEPWKGKVFKS